MQNNPLSQLLKPHAFTQKKGPNLYDGMKGFKQPLSLVLSPFTLWRRGVKFFVRIYQLWPLPGQGRWHQMKSVVVHCLHQFQATH